MQSHQSCNSLDNSTPYDLPSTNIPFDSKFTIKEEPLSSPASPKPSYRRGPIIVYGGGLKWNFSVNSAVNSSSSPLNDNVIKLPCLTKSSSSDKSLASLNPDAFPEYSGAPLMKRRKINRAMKFSLKLAKLRANEIGTIYASNQKHLPHQQRKTAIRAKCLFKKRMKEAIAVQFKDVNSSLLLGNRSQKRTQ